MSEIPQKQLGTGKKTTAITKKYTPEEARKMVLELAMPDGDLRNNLKNFGDNILPELLHGNEKGKKEALEKFKEKAVEVMMALEPDTHVALMESFDSRYRGLAKELSSQIIKDYSCITGVEKALTEVVVNAFIRIIDNSRRFNNCAEAGEYLSEERTKHLTMLSIQIDRANRQFLNALITLKQLKSPNIEMNIKTKTAFIAQNQQINADGATKPQTSETNESK
ncbi:MAG: hypothetical protein Q7R98_02330 [Candidatus Jorgensenbacteria bacterium]|nr:hypothetical protein [Candidatus Jorgensenbacteria bacterium]